MKKGDIAKYRGGCRHYKVTAVEDDLVELDSHYWAKECSLVQLNKLSVGDTVQYYIESKGFRAGSIQRISHDLKYHVNGKSFASIIQEKALLKLIEEYENRLQEQETAERGGNGSGVGEQLCCRDRICVKFGHRGNEYSTNQSEEQAERGYANLPLGQ